MSRTLADWLTDLENRYPEEIHLGLERVEKVADLLGLSSLSARVITVAGTNGKGSTVTTLESIYCAAGYQVGSYTSPHLHVFNERIKINKGPCSEEALISAFETIDRARGDIALTYFEIATLAALILFKQHPLDVVILEVGLGGRLDAVNIVDNDLAIITTIDFDHEDYLGNTLEAIGYEKAGIMRSQKPCIYADLNPPLSILTMAHEKQTPLIRQGLEYRYQLREDVLLLDYKDKIWQLPLSNLHVAAVAASVIATACLENLLPVSDVSLTTGILTATLPGRQQHWEVEGKTILVDVAHNPQSVTYLASFIRSTFPKKTIHAVFSAFKDKDISAMIKPLKAMVTYWYPAQLKGKRALQAGKLEQLFRNHEISVDLCYNNPLLAYLSACNKAKPGDLIVVYGSFLTVAAVLERRGYEINNG